MPTRPEELAEKQQQLADVRDAIREVLRRGQRVAGEGAEKWRADLLALEERERRLEQDVRALARGGAIRVYRVVPR